MKWQDAIKLSPQGKAIRTDFKNGLTRKMIRYEEGHGYIEVFAGGVLRPGQDSELEGFLDWNPDV